MPAPLLLSSFMFCAGLFLVLTQKRLLTVLVGTEVLLQAAVLNLIYFDNTLPIPKNLDTNGQLFALFVLPIAVIQMAIALSMLLVLHRSKNNHKTRA